MDSYLLSSTAFLSDLVEEGHRLPNVGFDVLGKFAFVAENLCGVHTSDYEREAFLLIPGLKNSQLGSSNDVYYSTPIAHLNLAHLSLTFLFYHLDSTAFLFFYFHCRCTFRAFFEDE